MTEQGFNEAVDHILRKPKYFKLTNHYDFFEKFKQMLVEKIEEFLEKFVIRDFKVSHISDTAINIMMIIGIIICIFIVIFIISVVKRSIKKEVKIRTILGEEINKDTTGDSLKNKSESYKEQGNYREAVRYDFIALLFMLNQKNIIYLDKAKTNIEIVSDLKKANYQHCDSVEKIVYLFNEIWYGHKDIKVEQYINWEQFMNGLWSEVNKNEGE